jgi:hypothetical protein
MEKLTQLIDKLTERNIFKIYLPIFRVYLSFHILKKIYLNYGSISILFHQEYNLVDRYIDKFQFLKYNLIFEVPIIIQLTIILAVLFAFGILKNYTALLLCLCNFIINDTFALFGNGGDNLLYFILIYMAFTNSYYFLSKSNYTENYFSNLISNLGVFAILFHLCIIYFVSALHKIHSDVWFNGVATYYVLNIERFCSPLNYLFSKNSFFIASSTYFTLLFETLFPILIWFKSTKNILLISGILMHLGIYFFMMIYDFEILFIMIYGFFISNEKWFNFINKNLSKWIRIQ